MAPLADLLQDKFGLHGTGTSWKTDLLDNDAPEEMMNSVYTGKQYRDPGISDQVIGENLQSHHSESGFHQL